jgi:Leucine-rich repeat (LRR) protein
MVSECNTRDVEVKSVDERVTSVSGKLMDVLVYENIKSFKVESSPNFEFLPKEIEKIFPNLEKITISRTGLKVLSSDDLKPFSKLKSLVVTESDLEELHPNLFEFNKGIEEVDLKGNKLKHLGVDFLKFASNLKSIDLSDNFCVNGSAKSPIELKRLKIRISENCPPSHAQVNEAKFSFIFLLMLFAAIIFVLIVFNCIRFVVG